MKSPVVKRSIVIAGHKTSVSLENEFWNGLKEIARDQRATLSNLVGEVTRGAAMATCPRPSGCSCSITTARGWRRLLRIVRQSTEHCSQADRPPIPIVLSGPGTGCKLSGPMARLHTENSATAPR